MRTRQRWNTIFYTVTVLIYTQACGFALEPLLIRSEVLKLLQCQLEPVLQARALFKKPAQPRTISWLLELPARDPETVPCIAI